MAGVKELTTMSSPSTGPYQSRLFNFVNRQSQRLQDKSVRAARHVKIVTVWGVQIVLYPVYLLVQTARLAGHRLQQVAKETWLQLQGKKPSQRQTPPAPDTPIQRVLSVVDTEVSQNELKDLTPLTEEFISEKADIPVTSPKSAVRSPEKPKIYASPVSPNSASVAAGIENQTLPPGVATEAETHLEEASKIPAHTGKFIRGIGSLLTTRTLVLVSADNEILDILTPQQQQKIIQRISLAIAEYWRQRKIASGLDKQFTGRVEIAPEERSRLLPPVRLFWLLMAWIQSSPVAIAANLFQESTFVSHQPTLVSNPNPSSSGYIIGVASPENQDNTGFILLPSFERPLTILDRTVAEIEAHPLQPVSELTGAITHSTQKLVQRLQGKGRQSSREATPAQPPATREAAETDVFGISSLIRAAIDYFFGSRGSQLPITSDAAPQAMPGDAESQINSLPGKQAAALESDSANYPQLTAEEEDDPWLTWGDIFPEKSTPRGVGKKQEVRNIAGVRSPSQLPAENSTSKEIRRSLRANQSNLQRRKPASDSQESGRKRSNNSINQTQDNSASVASITPATSDANTKQGAEWIETNATPAGYVKHPLERLLELLDRAMVWLERTLSQIWQLIINR